MLVREDSESAGLRGSWELSVDLSNFGCVLVNKVELLSRQLDTKFWSSGDGSRLEA